MEQIVRADVVEIDAETVDRAAAAFSAHGR